MSQTFKWLGCSVFFICIVSAQTGFAAAKAPPGVPDSCNNGSNPNTTTPNPVRAVQVSQIGTKVFQLPNGINADLNADLQTMLITSVANTTSFSATDPGNPSLCDEHMEIRVAVTNFQLNAGGVNLSFGYGPGGPINVPGTLKTRVAVTIGAVSMDFSVWKCKGTRCTTVAGATSDQKTAGVTGSFEIDFGQINTSTDFFYNSGLAPALRTIMIAGMGELSKAGALSQLPWQATVMAYDAASGTLTFDAGTQSRLGANQAFEIYAPTDSSSIGACNVFQIIALVHTTFVGTVASTAVTDIVYGQRPITRGDVVMIHQVN